MILSSVLTVSEVALILGTSDRNIRALCSRGRLEARITEQGTWLILKSSVEKYKTKGAKKMETIVIVNGKDCDYDFVVGMMDDDIREMLHSKHAPCDAQFFVNEYMEEHYKKFGEWFEIN